MMGWFKRDTIWKPTPTEHEQIRADIQRQLSELAKRHYHVVLDNGQEVFVEVNTVELVLLRLDVTWS